MHIVGIYECYHLHVEVGNFSYHPHIYRLYLGCHSELFKFNIIFNLCRTLWPWQVNNNKKMIMIRTPEKYYRINFFSCHWKYKLCFKINLNVIICGEYTNLQLAYRALLWLRPDKLKCYEHKTHNLSSNILSITNNVISLQFTCYGNCTNRPVRNIFLFISV